MKLYHTGFEIIKEPDIDAGRRNADFGKGFYLTDDREFAIRWAKKRKGLTTYINAYEFNTDDLNIKKLRKDKHESRKQIYPGGNKIAKGSPKSQVGICRRTEGGRYRQFQTETEKRRKEIPEETGRPDRQVLET